MRSLVVILYNEDSFGGTLDGDEAGEATFTGALALSFSELSSVLSWPST